MQESREPERGEPEDVEPAEVLPPQVSAPRQAADQAPIEELVVVESQYSGPVPSKEWFATVEALQPGSTQLMLDDYRAQREHERAMERESIAFDRESFKAFARYQTTRLVVVASLAALIAAAGIVLVATGHSLVGFAVLVAEIAGLVVAFFGRQRNAPPEDRSEDVSDP